MSAPPTKAQLIACVAREVRLREKVYPSWVARGRLKQASADRELATMKAVLVAVQEHVPDDGSRDDDATVQTDLFGGSR